MKVILSPAKKMRVDRDFILPDALPQNLEKTEKILACLRGMTPQALKTLWNCNDQILEENLERLRVMDLRRGLTPAILSYDGLAYQHMAPSVFEDGQLAYVQNHLRILSGFYGILNPLDGVAPYRLEMQARLAPEGHRDLYDFWGNSLWQQLDGDPVIINLASREYSKCIQKYLAPNQRFITCTFAEPVNGKMVQKATFAKMARGEMVRYMAEQNIDSPDEIRNFDRLDYRFRADLSSETEFFFQRCPHV